MGNTPRYSGKSRRSQERRDFLYPPNRHFVGSVVRLPGQAGAPLHGLLFAQHAACSYRNLSHINYTYAKTPYVPPGASCCILPTIQKLQNPKNLPNFKNSTYCTTSIPPLHLFPVHLVHIPYNARTHTHTHARFHIIVVHPLRSSVNLLD